MKVLGKDIQIKKMTYLGDHHTFDVEFITSTNPIPQIKRLNEFHFPDQEPMKILDGFFKIGQSVKVWVKDSKELKKAGWDFNGPKSKTLINSQYPFSIGKIKGELLGKFALTGSIGVSSKMKPYVVIKNGSKSWRFTEAELRFILPLDAYTKTGKAVSFEGADASPWTYNPTNGEVKGPNIQLRGQQLTDMINLLRKAEVI